MILLGQALVHPPSKQAGLDVGTAILSVTKREAGIFLAAVLALVLIGGSLSRRHAGDLATARSDVRAAVGMSQAAIARSDILSEVADSSVARAERAERKAAELASRPARILYLAAKESAPDTCAALVAAADVALANADSVSSELRTANVSLHTALDDTRVALAGVRAVAVILGAKASILERAARPSWASRLIPKPGIGIAAGVDLTGRPTVLVGVTFGWSVR